MAEFPGWPGVCADLWGFHVLQGFNRLVQVVWVWWSRVKHAINVGHTKNYSGNLKPLVCIPDFMYIMAVLTCSAFHTTHISVMHNCFVTICSIKIIQAAILIKLHFNYSQAILIVIHELLATFLTITFNRMRAVQSNLFSSFFCLHESPQFLVGFKSEFLKANVFEYVNSGLICSRSFSMFGLCLASVSCWNTRLYLTLLLIT